VPIRHTSDSTTIYPEIMPFGLREIASMIVCSRGADRFAGAEQV
jgi:hypothetical protein